MSQQGECARAILKAQKPGEIVDPTCPPDADAIHGVEAIVDDLIARSDAWQAYIQVAGWSPARKKAFLKAAALT